MANISTVEGDITLKGSVESLKAFLRIMEKAKKWHYVTEIVDSEELIKELDNVDSEVKEVNGFFFGSGRWVYDNNIKYLMGWLNNERKIENVWQPDWTIEDEMDWQQLNEYPIEIEFDYKEEESGNQILAESNATITWTKGKILEPIVDIKPDTMYDYTAENLRNIFGYEEIYDLSDESVDYIDKDIYEGGWVEYIEEQVGAQYDLTGIGDIDTKEHKLFIKELKQSLEDLIGESRTLTTWYSVGEWFEDEGVIEAIKLTLEKQATAK